MVGRRSFDLLPGGLSAEVSAKAVSVKDMFERHLRLTELRLRDPVDDIP